MEVVKYLKHSHGQSIRQYASAAADRNSRRAHSRFRNHFGGSSTRSDQDAAAGLAAEVKVCYSC